MKLANWSVRGLCTKLVIASVLLLGLTVAKAGTGSGVEVVLDPETTFPGQQVEVFFDVTGDGSVTAANWRLQYPDDVFLFEEDVEPDVSNCADSDPDWSDTTQVAECEDGTEGSTAADHRSVTVVIIGDNVLNPDPIPVGPTQIGPVVFTVDPDFDPAGGFPFEVTFTIIDTSSATADNEGDTYTLIITEGPQAELSVDPLEIDFGSVQTDTTSGEHPIAICNDGEEGAPDLTIDDITVSPAQFSEGVGSTCADTPFDLAQGECCNFHVTFSPDSEDTFTGTVFVESSEGDETVDLTGEGVPTDADLVINPDAFDFGELDIDADPACEDFTLLNDNAGGTNSLTIGTASIASPFTVSDNCDGAELAPGGSCVVEVCFDPDDEGTFDETLTATSDVNDATSDISGEGTAEANVTVSPPFGPVDLGVGEQGEVITANGLAENSGSADADLSCSASGDTDIITTDPDPLAATIPANDEVAFSISCALPEDGEEGDEFSITLSCDLDGEFAGEHVITCGISTFEPLPVPTMQAWALALFALLMLLAGGIGIRYFRAD